VLTGVPVHAHEPAAAHALSVVTSPAAEKSIFLVPHK